MTSHPESGDLPVATLRAALAGRYEVEAEIGRGGMALVFRAFDLRHHRQVAIKVIRPGVLTSVESADRFLREIRYTSQLTHSHILPLYDSGEIPGAPPLLYAVMPFLEGETLRQRIAREGRLPVEQAVRIGRAVAAALDHAHRRQILHRDVKPENILLHEGEPMLADFGVARGLCEACDGDPVTAPGVAVGTPAYMSPEQASADRAVDVRSDQYSLGCVVYEMLAGHPPFAGTGARATMARHAVEPPPPLDGVRPEVPAAVLQAVFRALAKDPADRFPSTADFAAALATPLSGLPAEAPPPGERPIAVLPFVNATADADAEYLCDGLTDGVISVLANLPGLRVASRTSVFALKGRREDVRTVGALLGVGLVLEGTVRRSADRLRVTVQLTDAVSGRVQWSERRERGDQDLFALEDDVGRAIADRLREELPGARETSALRHAPRSPAAYTLYLKGRYAWNKRNSEGSLEAIRLYQQAIAEDPAFALAYAGLADAFALQVDYRAAPVTEGMQRALAMARQALALDDSLAEAHCSLGWVTFIHLWDWEGAGRAFRRAIELDPRLATARQWHAWYLVAMGRVAEALLEGRRALELDPASVSIHRALGWLHLMARQPDAAVPALKRALVMNPEAPESWLVLGLAHEQQHRWDDAEAALQETLALTPDDTHALAALARVAVGRGRRGVAGAHVARLQALAERRYVSPTDQAKAALALGDREAAFAALDRAFEERRGWLVYLRVDPLFDPLREDARFRGLLRRMRLEA